MRYRSRFLSYALIFILFIGIGCGRKSEEQVYTGVVEGTSVEVPALTGGKILTINVDTGYRVKVGDTLAIIDTIALVFQRQQLQAVLEEVRVQQEMAGTSLRRARADLEYWEQKYQRTLVLFQNQSLPRQTLDDVANQLQRARSMYETASQNFQSIKARRKQLLAQLSGVRKKITDAVIVSPIDGIVSTKYYENGEAIPPLSPLVEVIHIDEVWVKIYVSQKQLPVVQYGQEVKVRVDGVHQELAGKVSWISPRAEFTPKTILTPETRTSLVYAVKILIPNSEGILKHGMPVEVVL